MSLAPNSAAMTAAWYAQQGIPPLELPDGTRLVSPHREWVLWNLRWRWLLDSWIGGETYRMAFYGMDLRGMPVRNLIRHKREYPSPNDQTFSLATGRPPGTDQYNQATDDDYELRRARTPVPTRLADVIKEHASKIYKREVIRQGPPEIENWWKDVDGRGTSMDQWISYELALLLLLLGQMDVFVDHPTVPEGEDVTSMADQIRLKLDTAIIQVVMPQNLTWWKIDRFGRYLKVVVKEPQDNGDSLWRYWDSNGWQCYDGMGKKIGVYTPHPYGEVPIRRVFDRRHPLHEHVGLPRYEGIAEMQRELYNRESELILSDTTQAHPLLQGPSDFVQADGTVPIGPSWLLPKQKVTTGAQTFYEGFEVVNFPKDGAASLRLNMSDINDAIDRAAHLTKPAGVRHMGQGTVSQSGLSKRLDQVSANDMLAELAAMLERAEQTVAELAWVVLTNGKPRDVQIARTKIVYPREFDLLTAEEILQSTAEFQACVAGSGAVPMTETKLLQKSVRILLPGLEDEDYAVLDHEIANTVASKAETHGQLQEAGLAGLAAHAAAGGKAQAPGVAENPVANDPLIKAYEADVKAFNLRTSPPPDTFMAHSMANQGPGPN